MVDLVEVSAQRDQRKHGRDDQTLLLPGAGDSVRRRRPSVAALLELVNTRPYQVDRWPQTIVNPLLQAHVTKDASNRSVIGHN